MENSKQKITSNSYFCRVLVHTRCDEKGSPVKVRRYPRSCKSRCHFGQLLNQIIHCLDAYRREGSSKVGKARRPASTETFILLSGEKHEMQDLLLPSLGNIAVIHFSF